MRTLWWILVGAVLMGAALHALQGCCADCQRRIRALEDQLDSGAFEPDAGFGDTGFDDSGMPIIPDGGLGDGGRVSAVSGGAVALPKDETFVLAVGRYTGAGPGGGGAASLIKFPLGFQGAQLGSPSTLGQLLEQATQVIIGPDEDTAYVSGSPYIQKITGIRSDAPTLATANALSEPRGIALSPQGDLLYVANWGEGTVSVINTTDMSVSATIDLNVTLAQSGLLGENLMPRVALAHPWGVLIDGETLYITEFFAQALSSAPRDDSGFDLGRQGIVYKHNIRNRTTQILTLAPRMINDQKFVDSNGATTGCFPNQLTSMTIHNRRIYVTAVCASPRGPVGPIIDPTTAQERNTQNFKTVLHSAIFVINADSNREVPEQAILLSQAFQAQYDRDGAPDDIRRRIPLLVSELAFVPRTDTAYLAAYGSDALYRIDYNPDGSLKRVGAPMVPFIDLNPDSMPAAAGRLPRGLAIASAGNVAFVINEHTRNVSVVSLSAQRLISASELPGGQPTGNEADINNGRRSFVTGRGRWSYRGQAWSSCEACHPNGHADGVTWFLRQGPRQTIPLDGAFNGDGTVQRLFNWSATSDEVHDYETMARNVSGAVGAIVIHDSNPPANSDRIIFDDAPLIMGQVRTSSRNDGLNGSTQNLMPSALIPPLSVVDEWDDIFAFVTSVRPPKAPTLVRADVSRGRTLFVSNHCDGCHGGEVWSIAERWYIAGAPNPTDPQRVGHYRLEDFPVALNAPARMNANPFLRTVDPLGDSQMNCALRSVGTFPEMLDSMQSGLAPPGVRVREVRHDMMTPALGALGFSPPSLLGLSTSAPYFHAGNARTLEELFTDTFAAHSGAMIFQGQFPGPGDRAVAIRQLVAFLLSLDDSALPVGVQQMLPGPRGTMFSPVLCPMQ